jgi:hypothetical protein
MTLLSLGRQLAQNTPVGMASLATVSLARADCYPSFARLTDHFNFQKLLTLKRVFSLEHIDPTDLFYAMKYLR